jgi:hypothetical protein
METLIHADIFFFVTTIAVALIASLFIVVIIYVVRILNDFRYISGVVRKEADLLAEDIEEIRQGVKKEGVFGGLRSMVSWLFTNLGKRSSEKKTGKASNKSKK